MGIGCGVVPTLDSLLISKQFWVWIAHWTRIRDLDQSEMEHVESLLYITFSRQLVHYQVSHRRHSSIENPQGSVAWDLDIVRDMMSASNMRYVDTDLCAWGAKDPWSGRFYNKTMRFACTFAMGPLARKCPCLLYTSPSQRDS